MVRKVMTVLLGNIPPEHQTLELGLILVKELQGLANSWTILMYTVWLVIFEGSKFCGLAN